MFACEYYKISNNTCFEEHLRMAASENDKDRFLGKATGHHDHYMINMVDQRPKICGKWLLTGPYLQRCKIQLRYSFLYILYIFFIEMYFEFHNLLPIIKIDLTLSF